MNLRIKHVKKAINVIFAMLFIFTIFNFISTDIMLHIGNAVEHKLGVHSNIDVEKVRSFFTTISSGILGSAIVAMIFYINEYNSEKREKILKIARENNKLQKIYREIPFIEHEGEYYKLEQLYYFEYLDNKSKRKFNESIDNVAHNLPKKMKREIREFNNKIRRIELFDHRNELKEVLENYPEIRKRRFSDDVIGVEQSLKDIIVKYDIYIDKMMETIKTLKRYDYEELKLCVEEYKCVFNFTKAKKRKILKYFNPEIKEIQEIYPFALNEKVSSEIIANRIYTIHKRFVEKIDAHMQQIEDIDNYENRKQAFSLFLLFQKEIYGTGEKVISEIEIQYAYNKLNMCVDNLQWILFGELTNRYEYRSQGYYIRKGESVEYGSTTKMIEMAGHTAYGDIYRK
ncbi:hypothetical protein [Lysinibacillus fusiformis]|uniref:hypothetical protein n=1 Tax=Lysinibacillus fusiformis TaxID=28031 RepID=UPI0035BF5D80|nr:hypothetical protein QYY55_23060 [Lysinibacillus fusiformis]